MASVRAFLKLLITTEGVSLIDTDVKGFVSLSDMISC
jgi:hypothetical protein